MLFSESQKSTLSSLMLFKKPVTIEGFNNYGQGFTIKCYILGTYGVSDDNLPFENVLSVSFDCPDDDYQAEQKVRLYTGAHKTIDSLLRPRLFVERIIEDDRTIYLNSDAKSLRRAAIINRCDYAEPIDEMIMLTPHTPRASIAKVLKANIAKPLRIAQILEDGSKKEYYGICAGINYLRAPIENWTSYTLFNLEDGAYILNNNFDIHAKHTKIENANGEPLFLDTVNEN